MTPEQQNKLEAIKSALRQHIEEAEKATPGTWVIRDYNVYQKQGRHIFDFGPHHTPISEYPKSCLIQDEANAAFIARARTMSPLACKMALTAIEALEKTAVNDSRNSHWWSTAEIDLETIINLWTL